MNITSFAPGRFSWAEVATPDAGGATAFYTGLLGLAAGDAQVGEGDPYTILNKDGKDVCGLYGMSAQDMQNISGGRAVWRAYFTVGDADQALKRVGDLGGTVIHEPIAIGTDGRAAVAQDPAGAVFSMWEPRDHHGAQVLGEPGALTWAELYTRDTGAASSFYGGLFGWTSSTVPSPAGGEYTLFQLDGQEAAGMLGIREEWGAMPPHWAVYFDVVDLDDARTRAGDLGGGEVMPPVQVEGVGRFAFLHDPQGGVFAVIQPEQREG